MSSERQNVNGEGHDGTSLPRAIDPWVNVNMLGGQVPPEWLKRVKEDYFKAGDDFLKPLSLPPLVSKHVDVGLASAGELLSHSYGVRHAEAFELPCSFRSKRTGSHVGIPFREMRAMDPRFVRLFPFEKRHSNA